MAEERLYWTIAEVAGMLGIGKTKAYGMARAGEIPALRRGDSWRIPKKAFARWQDAQEERVLAQALRAGGAA